MEVVIKQLNNAMSGVEFRGILNTNFENIKNAIENIEVGSNDSVIYTGAEITDIEGYKEGTIQLICNSSGINIKQLVDGAWASLCKYEASGSGGIATIYTDTLIEDAGEYEDGTIQVCCNENGVTIKKLEAGEWILVCEYKNSGGGGGGGSVNEFSYPITSTDVALEGQPFGYLDGVKTLAGTKPAEGDPVHAVGWYKNNKCLKLGRILLDTPLTAGMPVYVNNPTAGLDDFSIAINRENSGLVFVNTSSIPWTINEEYGGVKSGAISGSGLTEISTTIPVDGKFTFDYKVSSESNYDLIRVYKNDTILYSYSGTANADNIEIDVVTGDIIKFTYSKDGSGDVGDDAGYVRNVAVLDSNGNILSTAPSNDAWTTEKPENEGDLIQVIGFVSDDGQYIDIDIKAWAILA